MTSRYEVGSRTRRAVLGEAHVDRSEKNRTAFDAEFITLITESAWGSVWSRETISKRERSMITLALLAGLGHHEEFILHLKATRNTGATMEDIKDVLLHVAIYAGVPAANTAFRIAKQVYAEMAEVPAS
jgi:4-carboxymuconolactone decarboxylase